MPYITEEENNTFLDLKNKEKSTSHELKKVIEQKRKAYILNAVLATLFLLLLLTLIIVWHNYSKHYVKLENSQEIVEKDSILSYKQKISKLNAILGSSNLNKDSQNSLNNVVIYAVQIGAFKDYDINLFSSNLINFKEINSKDYNKYALGNFQTLDEAQKFRKKIVKLGFSDAFIASYKNGKRLKIEEPY